MGQTRKRVPLYSYFISQKLIRQSEDNHGCLLYMCSAYFKDKESCDLTLRG